MKISVRDEREENGKPVPERKTGRAANCGQGETGAAAQMPEREKTEKGKLRKVNGTLMLKNRRSCRVLFGSGVAGVYGYIEGCA